MQDLIPNALVRWALIVVGGFNALSAIGGGIGLLTPGSMGMPVEIIAGSIFPDFVWPAIILLVVIGGTQTLAVVEELRRARWARFWAAVAGIAMLIWIFVELAIMGGYSVLHGIYFVTGLIQVILVLALLDVAPGVVRRVRDPARTRAEQPGRTRTASS